MSAAQRQRIAQRIHTELLQELDQGIDVKRMLAQPLYARDVLLVCDAMRDTDLARLAEQYRSASVVDEEPTTRPSLWPDSQQKARDKDKPPSIWPDSWRRAARLLRK
jgi:hypothetical protein